MTTREDILFHWEYPQNWGTVVNPDFNRYAHNESCGDELCISGSITDGSISNIKYFGNHCSITRYCASVFSQKAFMPIGKLLAMTPERYIELVDMQGFLQGREKCVMLFYNTLQKALAEITITK